MRRLGPQPGERIDRAASLTFTFDGKPVQAFAGDTIASALLASGRHVLSRSFKYHRPRGEMDWAEQGAGSLMQVDGAPGVRAASEVVREVTDFGYGGEIAARPKSQPTWRELNTYNYFRRNVAGVQREWWFHRSGCRSWFVADRDTRTNEVLMTALPADAPPRA